MWRPCRFARWRINSRSSSPDDGVGFDPAELRGHTNQAGGFGLFSVRERLDLLGGKLEVESEPGKGSRFTLSAPAAAIRLGDTRAACRSSGDCLRGHGRFKPGHDWRWWKPDTCDAGGTITSSCARVLAMLIREKRWTWKSLARLPMARRR